MKKHELVEWDRLSEAAKNRHLLAAWAELCESGKVPDTIPRRPDLAYYRWQGWQDWFSNKTYAGLVKRYNHQRMAAMEYRRKGEFYEWMHPFYPRTKWIR